MPTKNHASGRHGCSLQTRIYGKFYCKKEKYIELVYRHRHPGRIGNQIGGDYFFFNFTAPPAVQVSRLGHTPRTVLASRTHSPGSLRLKKKKKCLECEPLAFNSRVGSPGPVGKQILRPRAPRQQQRDSSSLEQPEVPVLRPTQA